MRGHDIMFLLRNKENYLLIILNTPSYLKFCCIKNLIYTEYTGKTQLWTFFFFFSFFFKQKYGLYILPSV